MSSQNDFALLDHIGGECAGAVALLEPGQPLSIAEHDNDVQWLSDEEIVAILDELPHRPMLAGKDGLRLSLAGAQDKLPVVFDGERIGLPKNRTPSSHILKPPTRKANSSWLVLCRTRKSRKKNPACLGWLFLWMAQCCHGK